MFPVHCALSKNVPQPISNPSIKPLVRSDGKNAIFFVKKYVSSNLFMSFNGTISLTWMISAENIRRVVREMEGCENTVRGLDHTRGKNRWIVFEDTTLSQFVTNLTRVHYLRLIYEALISFFIFLFLGKMAMCSSGRGISSLVLISSLLFGSQSFAVKTSRRFIGLPESGERVNYSNARDNNKTLIIRHNLPVSDKIYLSFSTKCFDPLKY